MSIYLQIEIITDNWKFASLNFYMICVRVGATTLNVHVNILLFNVILFAKL